MVQSAACSDDSIQATPKWLQLVDLDDEFLVSGWLDTGQHLATSRDVENFQQALR